MAKPKKPKPKKDGPGAPTKKTQAIVDILLQCLSSGFHVETACGYAKINKTSFYKWLDNDKDFSTQVEFARSGAIMRLAQKVERDDPQGAWKLLKNVAPKLYRDKIDHGLEGKDGEAINIIIKDYTKKEDKDGK